MPKYKALEAKETGLPWKIGVVHTAKCSNCERRNEVVYRQCETCPYVACTPCFNAQGFKHDAARCKRQNGPFPTAAQELAILAQFDAEVPQRPASSVEPDGHSGWVPNRPDSAAATTTQDTSTAIPAPAGPEHPRTPTQGLTRAAPGTEDSLTVVGKAASPSPAPAFTFTNKTRDWRTPRKATPRHGSLTSVNSNFASSSKGKKRAHTESDTEADLSGDDIYQPRSTRSGRTSKTVRIADVAIQADESPSTRVARSNIRSLVIPGSQPSTPTRQSRIPASELESQRFFLHKGPAHVRTNSTNKKQNLHGMTSTSGTLTLDVSKIDSLRITLPEGFYTPSNAEGTHAFLPNVVFYQYLDENKNLNQEFVMRFENAKDPQQPFPQHRLLSGDDIVGGELKDKTMANFLNTIMSTRPKNNEELDIRTKKSTPSRLPIKKLNPKTPERGIARPVAKMTPSSSAAFTWSKNLGSEKEISGNNVGTDSTKMLNTAAPGQLSGHTDNLKDLKDISDETRRMLEPAFADESMDEDTDVAEQTVFENA